MGPAPGEIEAIFRRESRRVLATLIRLLGDFDLAEEALQAAALAALERWPREGLPAAPRAWLVSTGRFRAIDTLRRRSRIDASLRLLAERVEASAPPPVVRDEDELEDDRLRLLFACCHPLLPLESRLALTLREVGGLTTEEVARAFLLSPATVAQRIVRAKARLRASGLPFQIPGRRELPERLEAVLRVVYLVFNEGYHATAGPTVGRADLASEAIRLGRLLVELLPEPEAQGLLALMLLHEARRATRTGPAGDLVLLEDQDRARWDHAQIASGAALVEAALRSRRFGPYTLQAAIAAVHAEAPSLEATDWAQIVGLYDLLWRVEPSAVVALNRVVAIAMRDGPEAGLALLQPLLADPALVEYLPAYTTQGDLLRRLGRRAEAAQAFARALELARQAPEREFLIRRLAELE